LPKKDIADVAMAHAAYFARRGRSFRAIVTDGGLLHGIKNAYKSDSSRHGMPHCNTPEM
jgi:hypothetical protein